MSRSLLQPLVRSLVQMAIAAAFLTPAASAEFLDVVAVDVTAETAPPHGTVWRLHARFSAPTDQLLFVGSRAAVATFCYRATAGHFNDGGAFAGTFNEDFAQYPIAAAYDTYFTIGHTTFEGDTWYDPPWFICDCGVSAKLAGQTELYDLGNAGWYDTDPIDTPVTGTFLAIAQFWLPEGAGLSMSGTIIWQPEPDAPVESAFGVVQPDCNSNDIIDNDEIADGSVNDVNGNGIPDPCECIGDVTETGDVGLDDLVILLSAWGPCADCPADLDASGAVDLADLLLLLFAWGACPG